MVPCASFTYSSPSHESTVGKRAGDSESGQPRSATVSPTRLSLSNEEGIAYMPTFVDVSETKVKEFEICPILTQHFVYQFTNHTDFGCQNSDAKCYYAFRHRSTCVCASKEIDNGHNFYS